MSLTTEQVNFRLNITMGCLVAGFAIAILGGFLAIKIISTLGGVLFGGAIFYGGYLQYKYPDAIREITKPHNKARGGMLSDTLSGMDEQVINSKLGNLGRSAKPSEPAIKVRCQSCGHLNDETDKFCGECGKPV